MKDYIVSAVCLGLAGFVYFGSRSFAVTGAGLDQDPAYYPFILAALLAIMSVALFIDTVRKHQKVSVQINKGAVGRVALVFGVLVVYVFAIQQIGYLVSSLIFVPSCILLFGGKPKLALLGGLPLTIIVYYAFMVLLKVPLPKGVLFG